MKIFNGVFVFVGSTRRVALFSPIPHLGNPPDRPYLIIVVASAPFGSSMLTTTLAVVEPALTTEW